MQALYNEIDPYAAQWLRNLIDAGHIAPGVVDERSIVDLEPDYLARFVQCHFFAGIGVWSYALRLAGWPDDRPVWTGSCPCQPFSAAGKGEGHEDERHLWPAWFRLISECKPTTVFGEQVASADGRAWLDVVLSDLEGDHYAVAAADLPAAGVGAPHIRQRLFFVANAGGARIRDCGPGADARAQGRAEGARPEWQRVRDDARHGGGGVDALADAGERGRAQFGEARLHADRQPGHDATRCGAPSLVGITAGEGPQGLGPDGAARPRREGSAAERAGATRGFWDACDWIPCRDGKARPVEPGTFPLAHGAPSRVGRLRAYGNAIVAPAAAEFIRAAMTTKVSHDHT